MAGRESLDDKLAAIRALRGETLGPDQKSELRKRLGDRSNLVVAAAAAIVGENLEFELALDLEAAFLRFLIHPLKDDKLCRAKIALIQALDRLEYQQPDIFRKAATHVQFEPVWGGTEDSAAPLRASALVALARVEGSRSLPLLVDSMADAQKDVRIAVAVALGALATECAGLVLRLKARLGDKDPEVLSECLGSLLTIDPTQNLPLVTEFLEPSNASMCEAAALALGKSRLPEALEPLKQCLENVYSGDLRQQILLAIAILRRPIAIDFLVDYVEIETEPKAITALSVLGIYKEDSKLKARIASIILERRLQSLKAVFDREFKKDTP